MTDTHCLWTIADICAATNGQTHHGAADTAITGISIDSREIKAGDLFVALPGTVADGHKFLAAAQSAGASAALVSKIDRRLDLPQICVTDCLQALRQLGMAGRARFGGIQFGITGSVGKTGSKDMLRHALSQFGSCHASQRSFNNHIGVPISLASLPQNAEFAVQEMGMNAAGEIAELTKLTRPQIALITRIADSHSAFFASTADIAAAKAEIFQAIEGLSIAVLNRDDAFYETLHAAAIAAGAKQVINFGHHPEAAYRLVSITDHDAGMTIKACLAGTDYVFELRMYG
ncbi:MAG: UDP-N-acetylmuramoyl-tripeptide--D-alanyl-D-alanine ligase, partial [Candidatus Puniceispirillaceae bacterium]